MELLVALPVRVTDIVAAKLGATLTVTALVTVPLAVGDGILGMVLGAQSVMYLALMLVLVLRSMTFSICGAAGVAMLARIGYRGGHAPIPRRAATVTSGEPIPPNGANCSRSRGHGFEAALRRLARWPYQKRP